MNNITKTIIHTNQPVSQPNDQPKTKHTPLSTMDTAHTHARTHAQTLSLSLSLSHTHTHTHARTHARTHTHNINILGTATKEKKQKSLAVVSAVRCDCPFRAPGCVAALWATVGAPLGGLGGQCHCWWTWLSVLLLVD